MKQSNKNKQNTAAIYLRLSRDDDLDGESNSISNQRKLLVKVAREKGYNYHLEFKDDGISGTTMKRKGFMEMIEAIKSKKVSAVFVKDMSRLGRNYLEVGHYTEEIFPEHDIRLVAVSDGIDSAEGDNEFAPFRNIMNEWYARDISKKCRVSRSIKGNSGEPLSQPPYGYKKDPDNNKRWIVDEEAAAVVRNIYNMTIDGFGTEQIAAELQRNGIITPMNYWLKKGFNRGGKKNLKEPTKWNASTIVKILSQQEYCGDVINFKTYTKSYKNKRQIVNAEENRAIFKDVHEPIIDRSTWLKIQEKRGNTRKRKTNEGEKNMFSGLLVCADCGKNLWYHFNQKNPDIRYFNCSNYKGNRGTCQSTHYIRVDFLEEIVLKEVRRLTKFASRYENEFAELLMKHSKQALEIDRKIKEKELSKYIARDKELDRLFQIAYEDKAFGRLTNERYDKMTNSYESEQGEIAIKTNELRTELEKNAGKAITADMFIGAVRKYTKAKKLSERMLSELIERIEVYHAEIIDGVKTQRLVIHYNFVGTIEIPVFEKIPESNIVINTRKGVDIQYKSSVI